MFGFLLKCDEGEDSRYSCLLFSTPVSRYREEGREERQGRETGRTFYSLRRQARMETEEEGQVVAVEISSGQIFVYNFEGGWFWDILSFLDEIQNNFNIQTKTF